MRSGRLGPPDKERRPRGGETSEAAESFGSDKPQTTPPWEGSAWLRATVARRLRNVAAIGVDSRICDVVVIPLGGSMTAPGSRADRACDRCGVYVPPGRPLRLDVVHARLCDVQVFLPFGLCRACWRAESVA